MTIIGLDPGNTHSAYAVLEDGRIAESRYVENDTLIGWLFHTPICRDASIWCEMIASYGMAVGASVFETCLMIGRIQAVRPKTQLVTRQEVKRRVCGNTLAKDSNVRQALIDTFGPPGKAKEPGQTYGISGDQWAALAVAHAATQGAVPYVPSHLRHTKAA